MESSSSFSSIHESMVRNGEPLLANSTKSFHPSGLFSGLPHHRLHFFVVDISRKTAHAMALNKGHHIVFQGR